MAKKEEKSARPGHEQASIAEMVESIVGCKWSLHVLAQIRKGVNRPGAIERSADGLSAKVLGERSATVLSIALAALLCGVLHSSILAATIAGALYGWLRHASGSLMAPIIAHAVTNFIISMYVLTSGSWSYW